MRVDAGRGNISRRRFLRDVGVAAGALTYAGPQALLAQEIGSTERQRALILLESEPSFDLHCHPGGFNSKGLPSFLGPEAVVRTVDEMVAGRLWGGFFAIVSDSKILQRDADGLRAVRRFEPGEAWAEYERQSRHG